MTTQEMYDHLSRQTFIIEISVVVSFLLLWIVTILKK